MIMTENPNGLEETIEIAKKIFAKTAQSKIILTPEAYQLWFEYFAGSIDTLKAEMDEILASGVFFSESITGKLHTKYFNNQEESAILDKVHLETQKIIKDIFSELLTTSQLASNHGMKLDDYVEKLNSATHLSEVQGVVKGIVQETANMAESSRALQDKLKEATTQTEKLKHQLKKTEEEANQDGLTGLNNRKAFDKKIKELVDEFKRDGSFFSVIILDIDFFKKFNDTYGHQTGDYVLQLLGGILQKNLKGKDFPARYGGEEFIVLLPNTTLDQAIIVAEQLRIQISVKKPTDPKTGKPIEKITVSLGVSIINRQDTVETVVGKADKALYLAKDSGRNNVKSEKDLA